MGTQSATGPLHSQRRDNAVWMAIRLRWKRCRAWSPAPGR